METTSENQQKDLVVAHTISWGTGAALLVPLGFGFCVVSEASCFFPAFPFLVDDTPVVAGFFLLEAVVEVFWRGVDAFCFLAAGGKGGLPLDTTPALFRLSASRFLSFISNDVASAHA
jgi:hypothetical protein